MRERRKSGYVTREWGVADRVGKVIAPLIRLDAPGDLALDTMQSKIRE